MTAPCPVCHRPQPVTKAGFMRMHYSPTHRGAWCAGSARRPS